MTDAELSLDPQTFRRLGYRVIDALAERMEGLRDEPVAVGASRAQMEALLREPPPRAGTDADAVLDLALNGVLAHGLRVDHPRFFGFVPLPGNPLCALADALASGHDVFAGSWIASPGAAMVELVTLDWLRELLGLAPTTAGVFVSGARWPTSARWRSPCMPPVPSIGRSSCSTRRRRPIPRSTAPRACSAWGCAGPPPTTRPAPRVRRRRDVAARRRRLWRAGGAVPAGPRAARGPRRRRLRDARPAQVALPDAGARLPARPRRRAAARRVRRHRPVPARRRRRRRRGQLLRPRVQLTRQFGALKLWLSLKVHGVDAFERAIAHGIGLAEHAERVLEADSRWEVVTPAQLAIVTFRLAGEASVVDERTRRLVAELAADGHAVISSTQVHGRIALRLCTDNPRTTVADVEATVARLGELAANSAVV